MTIARPIAVVAALDRAARTALRRLRTVHGDQQGTISILSTFALLMFTMLLLLVTNVAMQIDDKVKMQNAADSAAYSGGVVLARGMNAVAYANHLECDILGVIPFLREARDQNVIQLVPRILEQWRSIAPRFGTAQFPKFIPLPTAIPPKADSEEQLALAWSEMAAAAANFALPVFEHILGTPENVQAPTNDHLLPNFQRAILASVPTLAQEVTNEVSLRHGVRSSQTTSVGPAVRNNPQSAANGRSPQFGVLWRTAVLPVGIADETDPLTRTLPIVDPDPAQSDYPQLPNAQDYFTRSLQRRNSLARHYLDLWLYDDNLMRGLGFFEDEAQMSAMHGLYRITTCAYLNELLNNEYPTTNVPMMLRNDFGQSLTDNEILDRDYTFVGVSYRAHVDEMAPKMFRNPIDSSSDALTFAQVSLYIPRTMYRCCPWAWPWYDREGNVHWVIHTNGWPGGWNLFNQNWMVRLVPTTTSSLPNILQSNPGGYASAVRLPNLGGATISDIDAVNTH
jgi:hypothetical protein